MDLVHAKAFKLLEILNLLSLLWGIGAIRGYYTVKNKSISYNQMGRMG